MNRERWQEIDRIFASVLEQPATERAAFLDKACNDDKELRKQVESLLAHDQQTSFLANSASQEAARLVGQETIQPIVGGTVGHYKILKKLGAGGMGEVFLAHDPRLNRSVALKLLSVHLTKDQDRVRRFRQEALAVSALNHPNILTIYEIEEHGDRPYIATEFVNGATLRSRMRSKKLSLTDVVDIALQTVGALSAAHDAGIVHRDIKPENIMIRPDGLVKILDFGIAKFIQPGGLRDSKKEWMKTATGVVIGTTAYMSPEHVRGLAVDARTDIWSLGVILYEMIARRLPFTGATPTDRIAAILEREPEPLSKYRRDVPPALEKLVNRCLAKNRNDRYSRAVELVDELREVRASLGDEPRRGFSSPALVQRIPRLSPRQFAAALIALLVIAVSVAWVGYLISRSRHDRTQTNAAVAAIDSLAVLPLANVGGSTDTEYLSDGITESLINNLSQLPSLKVMSRNSVFRYKGKEVDAGAVANALQVRAVLMGRVIQRGDDLDVSVELVDARDNSHVWGEQYKRKMTELVALQSDIARDVSQKLSMKLSGTDQQKLAKNYTENSEAYQLYLKGRFYWNKRTEEGVRKGIEFFRQAIAKDPNFALAYVGVADSYMLLGVPEALTGAMPTREALNQARSAAERALAIDDSLAEAHTSLAQIKYVGRDWAGVEDGFRRSISLNPNYAMTHHFYALYLSYQGRHEEALQEIRRALELDPLSLIINANLGSILYFSRRYDEAAEQCRKTLDMDQTFAFAHYRLGEIYEQQGAFKEAIAEFRQSITYSNQHPTALAALAHALALSGDKSEAEKMLARLIELSLRRYVPPNDVAVIYIGLGQKEQAFRWLERAVEQGDFVHRPKVDPRLDPLRSDPRFGKLLLRLGVS